MTVSSVPKDLLQRGCGHTNLCRKICNSREYSCDQGRDLGPIPQERSGYTHAFYLTADCSIRGRPGHDKIGRLTPLRPRKDWHCGVQDRFYTNRHQKLIVSTCLRRGGNTWRYNPLPRTGRALTVGGQHHALGHCPSND